MTTCGACGLISVLQEVTCGSRQSSKASATVLFLLQNCLHLWIAYLSHFNLQDGLTPEFIVGFAQILLIKIDIFIYGEASKELSKVIRPIYINWNITYYNIM